MGAFAFVSDAAQKIPVFPATSQIVLIITAAVLFYIAVGDLRHFRIPNEFIFVLTILFFVHAAVSGRWVLLPWNIGFAGLLFCVLLGAYAKRMLGGGDVKILAVAFLWTGLNCAMTFAICLLGFSIIHIQASRYGLVASPGRPDGRSRIAYAPSVAAALIVVFVLGCLAPLTSHSH